jgi:hypothetical protein
MEKYHKIQTVFKRDPNTNYKTLLWNEYSMPEFEYLKNNTWTCTEKVDGTNVRIQFDGNIRFIKGKSDNATLHPQLVAKLEELFPEYLGNTTFKKDSAVCLYGEGYGPKINKGEKYKKNMHGFALFDIKINNTWLDRMAVEMIGNSLNLEIAPIVHTGSLLDMLRIVQEGFDSKWGRFIAEGIVARPEIELQNKKGERIITKLKYKDFQR